MKITHLRPAARRRDMAPQSPLSAAAAILALRPEVPVACLRPAIATSGAARFVAAFPGAVLYAVKCNPDEALLRALADGGIRHFDAASIAEVRLVRRLLPAAEIHFMHPVKARSAIREAYFEHGVRDFVFDTQAELDKILSETDHAADLGLVVRLGLAKGKARLDLSGKFGAEPLAAAILLRRAATITGRVGLSFHVGSQCCDPGAWEKALAVAGDTIAHAGVDLAILDVGGGFPIAYPDTRPPPLEAFMAAIRRGVARLRLPPACALWCEPGRALVAAAQSLIVQVQGRRDD
ncbi:MAG: type III PLP-dependent enzyme, partial [Magnetospirillum sp.]|nr:type III PLP-dependent enzyme [Magnetospirillum sp.]